MEKPNRLGVKKESEEKPLPLGRKQHSVSIPLKFWEEIQRYYDNNVESFKTFGVDSPSELLRVLANFGKPKLEKLLSEFVALSKTDVRVAPPEFEQLRKDRKKKEKMGLDKPKLP